MMDGGLSPETEALLRRARQEAGAERMPATHRRRLKGAVLARIAFASTATLAAAQGAATAMGAGFVAKAVVAVAIVGSLGTGVTLALRPAHRNAAAPVHAPRVTAPVALAAPTPVEALVVAPPIAPKAPPARVRRPAPHHVVPDEATALAEETALLRDADRALRAGDLATALARLDTHATRFPRGVLAPEREGERLVVLCEVGAADPRAVARFLDERGGSPLAARVRRACTPAR
jgi:hypothetical protein